MLDVNNFDENKIDWKPLPGPDGNPADHIGCSILNVDDEAKIVDVLFRFSANEKIVNHRHTAVFNTFVVKGEHHIYDLQGNLKEVRKPGTFKVGKPDIEPHTEGGGDEDVFILFSLRPYTADGPIYEILDEDGEIASVMTFEGLKELYEANAA
ncbi:MAG: regulator [Pseudomonadota bacterium]|jgi:2,4'-dihydroxyacetophenone dioxygenase|nr:regulator [Gammaproteobacteria bacterium]MEC8314600.1 regulator [Pseudomonadota bacterium]MBA11656.1 regulator [Gammaproteobacteria bacterium]MEC8448861.1 regulator [Pseudomonadota bacterium]MEC8798165.1 regulator [Pseudomonadota bacterium]|tara:strand:+ start:117 stop:575 length:459 start_codon:yes stop_codon:yes gene_type:complete